MAEKQQLNIKGVDVTIDPGAITDVRCIRLLRDVVRASKAAEDNKPFDAEDMFKFFDLLDMVLGKEQVERVITELEVAVGHTSVDVISGFIGELFSSEKNS